MVTKPEYIPDPSPGIFTPTVNVVGAVPLKGVTVIQRALGYASKVSVPTPELFKITFWLGGLVM